MQSNHPNWWNRNITRARVAPASIAAGGHIVIRGASANDAYMIRLIVSADTALKGEINQLGVAALHSFNVQAMDTYELDLSWVRWQMTTNELRLYNRSAAAVIMGLTVWYVEFAN